MKVIVARTAGFCMGVRRALSLVLEAIEESPSQLFTCGPLIHNRQVVEMLEDRGVRVIDDPSEAQGGRVVLRAHGVSRQEVDAFIERKVTTIDATCPKVQRSERFVERAAAGNKPVIITGDAGHAEVKALTSRAGGEVYVVSSVEEALALEPSSTPVLVAQTTFNEQRYEQVVAELKAKFPEIEVLDSICSATHERQSEVRELARRVEAIVVVGGRHSANTRRLAEIAEESGLPAFYVEAAEELPISELGRFRNVGVTAGASTPGWVTAAVVQRLRRMGGGAWFGWLRRLFSDSGVMVSALAAAAAAFNQHLSGEWWVMGIAYVFSFMLCSYNLSRYYTGRRPYHVEKRGAGRLWIAATILGFAVVAVAAAFSTPHGVERSRPWRWAAKLMVLIGAAGPFIYPVVVLPWRSGRMRTGRSRAFLTDIPYLKDVAVGFAWLFTASLVQWVYLGGVNARSGFFMGGATFLLGVMQSIWGDSRNLDTDRLLGRGTLAVYLGRRRVAVFLVICAVVLVFLTGAALHLHWNAAYH